MHDTHNSQLCSRYRAQAHAASRIKMTHKKKNCVSSGNREGRRGSMCRSSDLYTAPGYISRRLISRDSPERACAGLAFASFLGSEMPCSQPESGSRADPSPGKAQFYESINWIEFSELADTLEGVIPQRLSVSEKCHAEDLASKSSQHAGTPVNGEREGPRWPSGTWHVEHNVSY